MRPRGEKFPCALAVRRAGAIGGESRAAAWLAGGGVGGGAGPSAALEVDDHSMRSSSVDEVDDHSMLRRRHALRREGVNRG